MLINRKKVVNTGWLLVVGLVATACQDSSTPWLHGTWQEVGGSQILTFGEDSLLVWREGEHAPDGFTRWRFVDSTEILIGDGSESSVVTVSRSGDLLTIGEEVQYFRLELPDESPARRWLVGKVTAAELIGVADSIRRAEETAAESAERLRVRREAAAESAERLRVRREAAARESLFAALPDGITAEMVERGKQVFEGAGICTSCHGPDGKGVPNLGADLTDGTWRHSDGSYDGIRRTIADGVRSETSSTDVPMPARGGTTISDDQVAAAAAYVWWMSHVP